MFVQIASAETDAVSLHDSPQGADITGENVTDGETVYVKVTNTNYTYDNATVTVSNGGGTSISVNVYDDGSTGPDDAVDDDYWGSFTVGTDITVPEGNDATVTADLDDDDSTDPSAAVTADYTAPAIGTATTNDSDANGAVDNVTVTFTEPINDSTVTVDDFTVAGSTPSSLRTGTADDAVVHLSLSSEISGTGVTPDVTLTTGSGGVADLAGNANTSGGTVTAADGASPVVRSGSYADTNADGTVDAINVSFSEDVRYSSSAPYDGNGWTVNANGITGLQLNGSGTVVDAGSTLSLPATADPMLTGNSSALAPNVTYVRGSGGDVVDAASTPNEAVDGTNATLNDSARPTVADLAVSDSDGDALIDAVNVTFTEQVTGGSAFADFGTITLPDGSTATGGTVDTAAPATTFDISGVGGQATANTSAGQTDIAGDLSGTWTDTSPNSNALRATLDDESVTDDAAPVALNANFTDPTGDGQVDWVNVTYSESVSDGGSAAGQWSVSRAGAIDVTSVDSVNRTPGATVVLDVTAATNATGGDPNPTLDYATTAGGVVDAAGNDAPTQSGIVANDSAAPRFRTAATNDTVPDGHIDRLNVTFTEPVTGVSTAVSGGELTLSGSDTAASIDSTASGDTAGDNRTILRLTEGSTYDTNATPTVADAGSSIADRAATTNELPDTDVTASDGAAPYAHTAVYEDDNADGAVDAVNVTYSEPIAGSYANADWTIGPQGTVELTKNGSGQVVGDVVRIDVDGAPDTTGGPTNPGVEYSGTSVGDAAGNLAPGQTLTVNDSAVPRFESLRTNDTDPNGYVDRIVVTFTEPIANGATDGSDFQIGAANGLTGTIGGLSDGPADNQTTLTLAEGSSVDTGATPTVIHDGDVTDQATSPNAMPTVESANATDGARPHAMNASYNDTNHDGTVETVNVTYSENVSASTPAAVDWSFPENGSVGIAGVTSATLSADDTTFVLTVAGDADTTGGSTRPTVRYAGGDNVTDDAGNDATTPTALAVDDDAAPVVLAGNYTDTNGNGTVDELRVNLSESVSYAGFAVTDWQLAANGVDGLELDASESASGSGTAVLTLPVNATAGVTGTTGGSEPAITYNATGPNSVTDTETNELAVTGPTTLADAARPTISDLEIRDTDHNGTVDAVNVTFTEYVGTADGSAPTEANFTNASGSVALVLPDGSTADLSGASFDHPADSAYVNVSGVTGQATANTSAGATDVVGDLSGEWNDSAGNALRATLDDENVTDSARPVALSGAYYDNTTDGTVDNVSVTFSEGVGYDSFHADDWNVTANGLTGLSVDGGITAGGSGSSRLVLGATAAANHTGVSGGEPTVAYDAGGSGTLNDTSTPANEAPDGTGVTLADGAAPLVNTSVTADTDADGSVDQLNVTLTEAINDTDSTLDSTTFSTAGSVTGTATNGTADDDELNVSVSGLSETGATPDLTLAANALYDDAGNALGADETFTDTADGAAPIALTAAYNDTNHDGTVETVNVTYSENVSASTLSAADWSFPTAGAVNLTAPGSAALASDDSTVTLGVAGDANTTGGSPSPAVDYASSANNLTDGAGNVAPSQTLTANDSAAPLVVSGNYTDATADGTVDNATLTFTEPIDYTGFDASDWNVTANDVDGFGVTGGTGTSTATLTLEASANAGVTGTTGGGNPVLGYDATGGNAVMDTASTPNEVIDGTNATLEDDARPTVSELTIRDANADGRIDELNVTFTEYVDTADGSAPTEASFTNASGSVALVLPDGSAADLSGATVSDPAGTDAVVNVSGVAGQASANTSAGATGVAGDLSGEWNDSAGNALRATLDDESVTDDARPVLVSGNYTDATADGTVDNVSVTFSEAVTYAYGGGEWDGNANGLSSLQLDGLRAGSGTETLTLSVTGAPNRTGANGGLQPNLTYVASSGSDVTDAASTPNEAADGTNVTLADDARPTVVDLTIHERNESGTGYDGRIDAVNVTFTEYVTPANGETLGPTEFENATGVALVLPDGSRADLSGASFDHPADSAYVNVTGVAGQATANTSAGATTLAGDLSDEWNDSADNRLVSSFGSVRVVDGAVPVATDAVYDDADDDGAVDAVNVTYSEPVANYTDADWTVPSTASGSRVNLSRTGSGRISGDRVEVDVAGDANVTGGGTTPRIAYTAGTLDDGRGNAAPSQSLDVNDSAPPRAVTVETIDSNRNGTVDRLAVTFTEPVDDASLAPGDFTGVSVADVTNPGGVHDNRTTLAVTGLPSGDTSVTPTLGVTATSLVDRSPLAVRGPDGGDQSLVAADGAAPVTIAAVADDTDGDGDVDRINVTLSEPINDSGSTIDASAYAVDSGSVDDVTTGTAADDAHLWLNVSGLSGTGATPDLTLQPNAIQDARGNSVDRTHLFTGTTSRAPPKVSHISVLDRDGDGNVDAANVSFTAAMNDASFTPSDWMIGGTAVDAVDTLDTSDDDAVQLRLAEGNEVNGTTATNVTYTAGTVTADNGRALADVAASDVAETDAAPPRIRSLTVTKPDSRTIRVTVTAGEPLATTRARITSDGAPVGTLTGFTETESDPHTYAATYDATGAGEYTVELVTAADAAGNDGAAGESGAVTLPPLGGGGGGGVATGAVTRSTSVPVTDSEPGQPGTTVPFGDGDSITFDGDVTGRITVAQLSSVPSDVAGDDGGDAVNGAPVLRSVRITAPEGFQDASATIRLTVSRNRLDGRSPDRLAVVRFTDEGPQRLQTSVARTTDERVTVEARTPGFSVFAVVLTDEDADATATPTPRPGGTPTPTPAADGTPTPPADGTATPTPESGAETTSGTVPGFTVGVTLVALVAAALLALRRRR
ncbi:PGF-CTERM sorting domain-containing protein [Salinirarus marinus]|uniref:beta strand repeat-containing protein n=2 Tax=Haloferacaceae TaxID=1644056 RepID=UPI003C6BD8C3